MQMIRFIFLATLLFAVTNRSSGQLLNVKPLMKGDTVSNFDLKLHIDSSTNRVAFYDLKKKLILLDFWGINCSSCIAQMPHLQSLQNEFKDDVQIIIVTANSKKEIDNLFTRLQGHVSKEIIYAWKHLPFIVEDSVLSGLFPHNGFPSHIWIDSAKVLRGIAYSNSTTTENVGAFLKGKKIKLAEMTLAEIDSSNPLSWINGENNFINWIKYYSLIFSRVEHEGGGDGQVNALTDSLTKKIVGFSCVNMRIVDLYKLSWFHYKQPNIGIPDNKILIEIKDREKFYAPKESSKYFDWADSSLFCYAINVPSINAPKIYTMMRQDLDRYFHYNSRFENRWVKCLVLKRISISDKILTKGLKPKQELLINSDNTNLNIQNQSMSYLFLRLESVIGFNYPFMPFFDATNYKNNIDIKLPWAEGIQSISIPTLQKGLRKYGLDLIEEYKILKMLVIRDSK